MCKQFVLRLRAPHMKESHSQKRTSLSDAVAFSINNSLYTLGETPTQGLDIAGGAGRGGAGREGGRAGGRASGREGGRAGRAGKGWGGELQCNALRADRRPPFTHRLQPAPSCARVPGTTFKARFLRPAPPPPPRPAPTVF
jgi:hypothetical protein